MSWDRTRLAAVLGAVATARLALSHEGATAWTFAGLAGAVVLALVAVWRASSERQAVALVVAICAIAGMQVTAVLLSAVESVTGR